MKKYKVQFPGSLFETIEADFFELKKNGCLAFYINKNIKFGPDNKTVTKSILTYAFGSGDWKNVKLEKEGENEKEASN